MWLHGAAGKSPVDALFERADANKDGKLTKDEIANFAWSHFAKADTKHQNAVTKDELKAYLKKSIQERRQQMRTGAQHMKAEKKGKPAAGAPKEKKAKPKEQPKEKQAPQAQSTPKNQSTPQKQPEANQKKADAKPASTDSLAPPDKVTNKSSPTAGAGAKVKDPKAGTSAT